MNWLLVTGLEIGIFWSGRSGFVTSSHKITGNEFRRLKRSAGILKVNTLISHD
jgi:hypothetical protein